MKRRWEEVFQIRALEDTQREAEDKRRVATDRRREEGAEAAGGERGFDRRHGVARLRAR